MELNADKSPEKICLYQAGPRGLGKREGEREGEARREKRRAPVGVHEELLSVCQCTIGAKIWGERGDGTHFQGTPREKGFLMVVSLRTFWPKCSEMIKGSLWRPLVSISNK